MRLIDSLGKMDSKNQIGFAFVLWTLLTVLSIGADIAFAAMGMGLSDLVPYFVITGFFVLFELFVIYWFYKDCVKPKITLEKTGDSSWNCAWRRRKNVEKGEICMRSSTHTSGGI